MIDAILTELLNTTQRGVICDVRIGIHWTAVVAEVEGVRRCGLASTLFEGHLHQMEPQVPMAGRLIGAAAQEVASFAHSQHLLISSIGIATINALLPSDQANWIDANAEELIAKHGQGKRVVLVGHFPFISRLRSHVGELIVLEQEPQDGDLPAFLASDVIPQADVVAITGMTLINHTLDELLELCNPHAFKMILGPSTPLSPVLFKYGVDLLSGAWVTDIEAVLRCISQGGNFRQIHAAGVRLVNIGRTQTAWHATQ